MAIKEKIKKLPDAPGVYFFKDAQAKIIYIGKANSLKKRVQSYFNRPLDAKTQVLVSKITDLDFRPTPSPSQAQILEAALIKENQPQYNIDLKDDKSFPWIRITNEDFPVVSICRRACVKKRDTSLYFGPYTNVKLLRQAFKLLRRTFGFRSCRQLPKEPCLYYRLKLCPAPCAGKISKQDYRRILRQIKLFLELKYEKLLYELSQQMQQASAENNFEEAAEIRDRINALSVISQTADRNTCENELQDLKGLLKLNRPPLRIEAFDISDISGKEAAGAMVSFYKGVADKNNYRRFRIKTVSGIDDYQMIREIVRRRYQRVIKENLPLPDLILIDGGRGHLSVAKDELDKLGIDVALASIAKDRENIYFKSSPTPIKLKKDTAALNLIRRIRDEAHRFAIKYHHLLHKNKVIGK